MSEFGQGVSAELARRNPSFQRFGQVGLLYMSFFTAPVSESALFVGWLSRGLEAAPAVRIMPQFAGSTIDAAVNYVTSNPSKRPHLQ